MPDAASPIWHPFTQHAVAPPAILIERGEGARLITPDGRRIIDAIASWWVTLHGHGHPRIAAAIAAQAATLEQVIFAGFTHAPAETLARRLLARAPAGLEVAFFSDSGSTAVEVAVKMAVGFWHHRGEQRTRIVALEDGYHGDTFGAMACGARGLFTEPYWPMLFHVERLPFPRAGAEEASIEAFAALLQRDARSVAALILEPLVLGAGGMRMYSPWLLQALADLCRRHGVLLIADEVMTGFGRTGTFFACEQAGVAPDLMCLSKGLTGGFLPLGVTLATKAIYDAFYTADRAKMFFHSSSYTGNPIACAAALASLDIWDDEPVFARIEAIAAQHRQRLEGLRGRAEVVETRQAGTIAAIELRVPAAGYLAELGPRLYRFFLERDVLLRPLGNVVYVLPPYCITRDELDAVYDAISEALTLVNV
ncbi:MAG: adenosylmethionine--8-amino-7-oxononanoate transaminase [Defluviicoccus sp.]